MGFSASFSAGFLRVAMLLLLGLVFLVGAGTARAEADTVPPELAVPYAQALAFWGIASVPGCNVTVEYADLPGEEEGDAMDCLIHIDTTRPPCGQTEILEHEIGHLLGYEHSADPDSVMYPSGDQREPVCTAEEATKKGMEAKREARRCRHRRLRRAACFVMVRIARSEARHWWRVWAKDTSSLP